MRRYAVGIDPGLGETGVVLCDNDDDLTPIAWATFCSPTGHTDLARVVSMAATIVNQILDWVLTYDVREVDIGIELPVLAKNPAGFGKQIRLLQEIESGVFHIIAGETCECWVTEVNPTQSKILAAGHKGASKQEIIDSGPFKGYEVRRKTLEALADAWAHANATWSVQKNAPRINFAAAQAAPVDYKHAGGKT